MSLFSNNKGRSLYQDQVTSEHFCIFCYKTSNAADGIVDGDLFFKLLERFVGEEVGMLRGGEGGMMPFKKNEYLGCCEDCGVIIGSFSEVYHQLKCLELQLEWKLESLVNIMRLANKVPSRVQRLKEILEEMEISENMDEGGGEVGDHSRLKSVNTFRTNLIRKCSRRLSHSQPRILLKRKIKPEASQCEFLENKDSDSNLCVKEETNLEEPFSDDDGGGLEDNMEVDDFGGKDNKEAEAINESGREALVDLNDVKIVKVEPPENIPQNFEQQEVPIETQTVAALSQEPEEGELIGHHRLREMRKRSYQRVDTDEEAINSEEEQFDEDLDTSSASSHSDTYDNDDDDDEKCHENVNSDPDEGIRKTDGTFNCKFCGRKFLRRGKLKDHVKLFHREDVTHAEKAVKKYLNKLICPVVNCTFTFKTLDELQNHQKLHGNFPCQFCDICKEYAPDLAFHEMKQHSDRDPEKMKRKRRGREGEFFIIFGCSRCPLNFSRKPTFLNHFVQKHLKVTGAGDICPICKAEGVTKVNKSGERSDFLRNHFQYYHDTKRLKDPSNILKCDQCPAYFLRGLQLKSHKLNFHFENKCPKCDGMEFRNNRNLTRHILLVHPDFDPYPSLPFACDLGKCGIKFATEEELNRHKSEANHDGEMEEGDNFVKCLKCEKQYKTIPQWKKHNYDVHSEKTQICGECGKAFMGKHQLNRHMLVHKGPDAWKFQCSECGQKFAAKRTMEDHIRRLHRKEKPFQCQF